jgi:hypothetical protein
MRLAELDALMCGDMHEDVTQTSIFTALLLGIIRM